jgi:hypothetical protein
MRDTPNPGALVAGGLFIVVGVLFLIGHLNNVDVNVRWLWPALLIGLGVAGLVRSRSPR